MGLKFLYTIFVGLLIASFVGFGIEAFYPTPSYPEYPTACEGKAVVVPDGSSQPITGSESEECTRLLQEYNTASEEHRDAENIHNRNVSLIALTISIIILAGSLALAHKIDILADGLVLGGTLTLFYGIIRGLMTDQAGYRFAVVGVGLLATLVIGYLKFVRGKVDTKA